MNVTTASGIWLETLRPHLRRSTMRRYETLLDNQVLPRLGDVEIEAVRPQDVQKALVEMMSVSTHNATTSHALMKRMWSDLVRQGVAITNPVLAVRRPKHRTARRNVWTIEQSQRFLEVAASSRYYPAYVLALSSALRISEVLGLRVEDVDLREGKIHVLHQLEPLGGGEYALSPPKTEASLRTLPLSPWARQVLETYLMEARDVSHPALIQTSGKWTSPKQLAYDLKKTLLAADLPVLSFHELRHTCATMCRAKGVDLKIVQQLLGHARYETTANTYTHVYDSEKQVVADTMNSLFSVKDKKGAVMAC